MYKEGPQTKRTERVYSKTPPFPVCVVAVVICFVFLVLLLISKRLEYALWMCGSVLFVRATQFEVH